MHCRKIEEIIRVNQAGEDGAVQIYKGQMKILKSPVLQDILGGMLAQEEDHLKAFNAQLKARRVRPTLLGPLWSVAGFTLGAVTALWGEKAAMACTVAVEEVIDKHYQEQQEYLKNFPEEEALYTLITHCREDECHHRDIGYAHKAEEAVGYPLLVGAVKTASRVAIWLSKRF